MALVIVVGVYLNVALGLGLYLWAKYHRVSDAVLVAIGWPALWPIGLALLAVDAIRTRLR